MNHTDKLTDKLIGQRVLVVSDTYIYDGELVSVSVDAAAQIVLAELRKPVFIVYETGPWSRQIAGLPYKEFERLQSATVVVHCRSIHQSSPEATGLAKGGS